MENNNPFARLNALRNKHSERMREYLKIHAELEVAVYWDKFEKPKTLNPRAWELYAEIVELRKDIEAIEAAHSRCLSMSKHLVTLLKNETPTIKNDFDYSRFILPFKNSCTEYDFEVTTEFITYGLPGAIDHFIANDILTLTGGDFSMWHCAFHKSKHTPKAIKVVIYFIK